VARRTELRIVGLEDFTPHYARTLRHWRRNLEAAGDQLERLGYDRRFRRLWNLYLCYCEAGFLERRVGVVQITLTKPNADAPSGNGPFRVEAETGALAH
jgi:cyclopropane-fatty-acyl-phospholipid synthase